MVVSALPLSHISWPSLVSLSSEGSVLHCRNHSLMGLKGGEARLRSSANLDYDFVLRRCLRMENALPVTLILFLSLDGIVKSYI